MMPTYKYECPKCREIEVAVVAINKEQDAPKCPQCDLPMVRLYGIQTVIFKGAGWGADK